MANSKKRNPSASIPKVLPPPVTPDVVDDIDDETDDGVELVRGRRIPASAGRRRNAEINRWSRWAHVYLSMIAFVVMLFFGVTGLTLNHPSWTLGGSATNSSYSGTLPASYKSNGTLDLLAVSEFVRSKYSVSGHVADYNVTGNNGAINYAGPGYTASLTFAVDSGTYTLNVTEDGLVAVMNDLHKGRDSDKSWKWVIDLSALFLVLISVSGLMIQVFQRKRRTRALVFAAGGLLVTVVCIWFAVQ